MKDRIQKIIDNYSLTSNSFAQEIDVNRSTISHILSGRNKPSIEVIQKILKRFNSISSNWLILGNGEMLVSSNAIKESKKESNFFSEKVIERNVEKVIIIYSDQSFKEYKPS